MGALHEGHLSLIRAARRECEEVVVSIFVNALQFGPGEDFSKYPRQEASDVEMCKSAGADWVFIPPPDYILGVQTTVSVPHLSGRWEGKRRPGHFDGVATIVARLFGSVQPTHAYFGLKDYQQCRVVAAMIEDLAMLINLRLCETVREPDGLAKSSRNTYLSEADRANASLLSKVLVDIRSSPGDCRLDDLVAEGTKRLELAGFIVDYLAVVDERTLEPLDELAPGARTIVAAKLGSTWLIDNMEAGFMS